MPATPRPAARPALVSRSLEEAIPAAPRHLYTRLALFAEMSLFNDDHQRRKSSGDSITEARRDFLDSFAYLCDVRKGGGSVTAIGLQRETGGTNILWLAANEGIDGEVRIYAESLLSELKRLCGRSPSPKKHVERRVFGLAMKHCSPRITWYKSELGKYVKICAAVVRNLETQNHLELNAILEILELNTMLTALSLERLVNHCYSMRGARLKIIQESDLKPPDDFRRLSHLIGRLGATRSSVHAVVRGMVKVPALRRELSIGTIKPPGPRKIQLDPTDMTLSVILHDMHSIPGFPGHDQVHKFVSDFRSCGHPRSTTFENGLAKRKAIVTRVHAEIQVADYFRRHLLLFADDDNFIGCSKSACYFCFNWLSCLRYREKSFVLPATHHGIIPGCRGPDIDSSGDGVDSLKEMYELLSFQVGRDILKFLQKPEDRTLQCQSAPVSSSVPVSTANTGVNTGAEMDLD